MSFVAEPKRITPVPDETRIRIIPSLSREFGISGLRVKDESENPIWDAQGPEIMAGDPGSPVQRIIAAIHPPETTIKILGCLGRPTRAPPIARARTNKITSFE